MVPLSPKKSTGGSKNLLNLLTSVHPFLGIFEAAQFFFDFLLTLAKSPVEKSHLTIFSDAPLASFLAWQIWEKSPSIVDVFEALGIIQDTTKHIWAHQPKMFDSTIRHLTIFRERTVNTYTILHYRSLHYTFPYQPASIYNQQHTTWTNRLGQFFFWFFFLIPNDEVHVSPIGFTANQSDSYLFPIHLTCIPTIFQLFPIESKWFYLKVGYPRFSWFIINFHG